MKYERNIDVLAVILDIGLTVDNSAVFQSQVLDQIIALKDMGYKVGILCVCADEKIFLNNVFKKLNKNNIDIFYKKDQGIFSNLFYMVRTIRSIKRKIIINNAYVRGIWGALALILSHPFSTTPYLYDIRGDIVDEARAADTNYLKSKIYLFLEKLAISHSKHISVVSIVLKEVIERRIWKRKNVSVVPSCVDCYKFNISSEEFISIRRKLNILKDDVVLIYSGGLSHYQKVPEMLDLWHKLYLEHKNIKFILLTNSDPHSLPDEVVGLDKFGSSLHIFNLPRSEVFSMLGIADIAFLLRDDRDLNKVASPVKFAEYIASGLSVIGSPCTGDISKQISENNIGILISPSAIAEQYNELSDYVSSFHFIKHSSTKRSKDLAKDNYDWKSYKTTFNSIYGKPMPTNQKR